MTKKQEEGKCCEKCKPMNRSMWDNCPCHSKPEECNHDIESNMTPAHCRWCKILLFPEAIPILISSDGKVGIGIKAKATDIQKENNQFYYNRGYLDARLSLLKEISAMKKEIPPPTVNVSFNKRYDEQTQAISFNFALDEVLFLLKEE